MIPEPDRREETLELCPNCGGDAGDNHFDRSLCACGAMHTHCNGCGHALDGCKFDPPVTVVPGRDTTREERLAEIARTWSTLHDRGAHDYTDGGCRVLAEHGFRDVSWLLAEVASLVARQHKLEEAVELAVTTCLPLLPLTGSWEAGYRVTDRITQTLVATVEEWAEAAHAISSLHAALLSPASTPEEKT